ncbi:MAG: hypothetical protein R6T98_12470 [Desulfatiglandales bacterium]
MSLYYGGGDINRDIQPDVFGYNFAGNTGSFVLDHQGEPHFIPYENFKIESGSTLLNFDNYTLTTPEGIQYNFNEPEYTDYNNDDYITSALHLTSIKSPAGDSINLYYSYIDYSIEYNTGVFQAVSAIISETGGCPAIGQYNDHQKLMRNTVTEVSG